MSIKSYIVKYYYKYIMHLDLNLDRIEIISGFQTSRCLSNMVYVSLEVKLFRCRVFNNTHIRESRGREKPLRRIGIYILNTSLWGARDDKWTAHDGPPSSLPDFFTSPTAVAFARGFLTSDD